MGTKPKHVYIFGNSEVGFHGHCYDKETADGVQKYRKGFKRFKIKNDDRCESNLSINTEFINLGDNIYMTCDEEEYYLESFGQYKFDSINEIYVFLEVIKNVRFTKEEKRIINNLLHFLYDYEMFIREPPDFTYDDDYEDIFNPISSMKYFIKYVLDADK